MKYLLIRGIDSARVTVLYKDNHGRVCRQSFAVWQRRGDNNMTVVTWEDGLKGDGDVAIVGDVYSAESAGKVLQASIEKFIEFATKKLREELHKTPPYEAAVRRLQQVGIIPGVAQTNPLQPGHQGHISFNWQ